MPIIFECDGCSTIGIPNDAWLQVSINAKPPLLFCDFACLSRWAANFAPRPPTPEPLHPPPGPGCPGEGVERAPEAPPLPSAPISVRCEIGEHFKQGEAAGSGKEGTSGCDGAMPISMTDHGAPNQWIECACWCHNATRRAMIEAWNGSQGKYGLANSGPLVVA